MKRPLLVLLLAFSAARLLGQYCVLDTAFGNGGEVFLNLPNWRGGKLVALPDSSVQVAWSYVIQVSPWDASFHAKVWNYSMELNSHHHWGIPGSGGLQVPPGDNNVVEMVYRDGFTYLGGNTGLAPPGSLYGGYVVGVNGSGAFVPGWGGAAGVHNANTPGASAKTLQGMAAGWGRRIYYCGVSSVGGYVSCIDSMGQFDPYWNQGADAMMPQPAVDSYYEWNSIVQDHQGRIVVGGNVAHIANGTQVSKHLCIARLLPNGEWDLSFGSGGIAFFDHPGFAFDVATEVHALHQERYMIAGYLTDSIYYNSNSTSLHPGADVFALQVTVNGQVDSSFGAGGWSVQDVQGQGKRDVCIESVLLPDDRLLLGCMTSDTGNQKELGLLLLNGQGAPDTLFGPSGAFVYSDQSNPHWTLASLCLHPAGKIYAIGAGYPSVSVRRFSFPAAGATVAVADGGERGSGFNMYPNPAQPGGSLMVLGADRIPVQLIDLQGRVMAEWPRGGELQLPQVPAGLYLVRAGGITKRLQVR